MDYLGGIPARRPGLRELAVPSGPSGCDCEQGPETRISERDGRVFCGRCLRYLNPGPETTPGASEATHADDATNDASSEEEAAQ